jgi:sugar phosphate isomerase/epimerase
MKRILSFSTACFDGYDLRVAFDEIKGLGVDYVEIAFIQGYTDPFGEEVFSPRQARRVENLLLESGLSCYALSAHMNLVTDQSAEIFRRRMGFACEIGAKVIVTNAGPAQEKKAFLKEMAFLSKEAEALRLFIGLENPGDGRENIINCSKDGAQVIQEIDSEWVRLNYDFGNLLSHRFERVRPEEDYLEALPYAIQLHLKDVKATEDGWHFTEIGKGTIDFETVLRRLEMESPLLPLSFEIPLRLTRGPDASPRRNDSPIPLDQIRQALKGSLDFLNRVLGEKG